MKTLKKILQFLLFAVTVTTYAQPTDNVVAYYPFNGNAGDVTGNGKNASVTGATLTADRMGRANAAYSFNGSSNYMLLPTLLTSSNAFAISCWIKIAGNHSTSDVGQVFVDLRGQYQIALTYFQPNNAANPGTIQFYNYSNPATLTVIAPANSIQVNNWYHIVASYGNNSMALYVNGALAGTQTGNAPSAVSGYNSTLGKDYATWMNRGWFYGAIDELIFYKRNLTSAEVLALYNRGLATSDIPELFAAMPVQYSYNATGKRINRKLQTITLKSANFIASRDSAGMNVPVDSATIYAANHENEMFEDNLGEQKVIIYPNPTKGQLKIEIQGYAAETGAVIYLYNLQGTMLINKKPATSPIPLDLSGFSSGTYILKIMLGNQTSEWKIVKE